MRNFRFLYLASSLLLLTTARGDDAVSKVKKAVEQSTLNQEGTKPFHLKASIAPTREADNSSDRTGTVEYWWASPSKFRREIQSPGFRQILIVNGEKRWEKNEGTYFPEWLREITVALVEPVPNLSEVLKKVDTSEARSLFGSTHYSWNSMSSNGIVEKGMGAGISINNADGLYVYGGDLGWGSLYKDYKDFHGRKVGRTVTSGSPEVTARIEVLEDLKGNGTTLFSQPAGEKISDFIETKVVDEASLRKNLIEQEKPQWPELKDGPVKGVLTTTVVLDREGKVRDVGTIVSDNPGVDDAAIQAISRLKFQPYVVNGIPVQAVSRITMGFETTRPPGTENFDSAKNYFERGRSRNYLSAGKTPYEMHATFRMKLSSGLEEGQYRDVWQDSDHWMREATIGKNHLARSRDGEKTYSESEGPEAPLLQFIFRVLEPIPALDTMVESDWRIKRDMVEGSSTVRVLTGYESPEGELDPAQVRGFWFDSNDVLLKTYFQGMESRREAIVRYQGVSVAKLIRVLKNGQLAMHITVTQLGPLNPGSTTSFAIPKHEWVRQFTDQVR